MLCPEYYEWWIDAIQDCMCQIAGRFDSMNPRGSACRHVCDETYVDLWHFVDCVETSGYNDVPASIWRMIVDLSKDKDLESGPAKTTATTVLESAFFQNRPRWQYGA